MANDWCRTISNRLRNRNLNECSTFSEIILANNRLFDENAQLRSLKLNMDYDGGSSGESARLQILEKKLMTQQEELTELHKRKGENAQMIVEMNIKLSEKTNLLQKTEKMFSDQVSLTTSLKAEIQMLTASIQNLKEINSTLRDEHTALQLAFNSLEEKYRKIQDENRQLVDQLLKYKAVEAEQRNEENESFLKKRADTVRNELINAMREDGNATTSSSPVVNRDKPNFNDYCGASAMAGGFFSDELPKRVQKRFDAHEGEVNAVRWSPVDRIVATGGADRKVKLWDVGKGVMEPKGSLVGSNAGINSVDFDSTGTLIMGTSNDFATRVWNIADQKIRCTLTGHSGKVMAAKFFGEPRVVTGSHDATLKIWDLKSKACIETKFAGSRCNDLVITDGAGSTIISGHFDKKIRFWDTHTHSSVNDIEFQGKITSLDLSKDCNYLISCVRDNTIKLIDLRQNQIITTFSNDNFKVSCDSARIAFNPNGHRIAAGSADGSIYIWNINGNIETILKDNSAAITAVCWHPFSSVLASVDRSKKCTIWADA